MNKGSMLLGKVAVVTGSGRGIGRDIALQMAAQGAKIVVNDIGASVSGEGSDAGPGQQVLAEIKAAGGEAVLSTDSVSDWKAANRIIECAADNFGRIDIVVNNAGFAHGGGEVESPDPDQLMALLAVHYLAAVGTMSAAFVDMKRRMWGRIINTVSEVALDTRMPGSLGYGAAKAAVWSATITAARTGGPLGITVNAISPGARTRMNEDLLAAGALGDRPVLDLSPQHVADVVAYLASDAAGDISGRIIHAAGGAIREYSTTRSSQTEIVERLSAVVR